MCSVCILEPEAFPRKGLDDIRKIGRILPANEFSEADIIFCRISRSLDAEFINSCPRLKYIVSPTTGLDHIDLHVAEAKGIKVISLKGETKFLDGITATAEMTWALIMALVRKIPLAAKSVQSGHWDRMRFRGMTLKGCTIGLIGVGRVGKQVSAFAKAFDMRVLGFDPNVKAYGNVIMTESLEKLLMESDIVSVHVTSNRCTREMIGEKEFNMMRDGTVFINTSRGAVVSESALLDALKSSKIKGAALDVVNGERDGVGTSELVKHSKDSENLIITPHIGGATVEAMATVEQFMVDRLIADIKHEALR